MPFSNLDYLYQHLPARVRRDDDGLFLKRFCQVFGITLDEWDVVYETFYQKIAPETAPEEFINFWLWALFGWSWYPKWFTLARKRQLYADFAQHLARRGTKRGIEEFLKAFSIYARVSNRPQYWGEFVWGEGGYTITDALGVVVQISHLADEVNKDVQSASWGEFAWGESNFRDVEPTLTRKEIEDLIRFEWPLSHRVMVDYQVRRNVAGVDAWESDEPIFNEDIVPDETSGTITGAN
ncbi:MAG: phage tail protein [Blastocatellia bacterium]